MSSSFYTDFVSGDNIVKGVEGIAYYVEKPFRLVDSDVFSENRIIVLIVAMMFRFVEGIFVHKGPIAMSGDAGVHSDGECCRQVARCQPLHDGATTHRSPTVSKVSTCPFSIVKRSTHGRSPLLCNTAILLPMILLSR